jgi:hypothetical protein
MRLVRKLLKVIGGVLLLFVVWSAFRATAHATAFRREIVANVSRDVAWDHFSRPKQWSSWLGAGAPTEVTPSDVVGPDTVAKFGGSFTFRMSQFKPTEHWMWTARLGWLTIDYDHTFERISDRQTRMVFRQTVTGFGNDLLAVVIRGATAASGHQAALNRLADEMNRLPAAPH